MKRGTLNIHTLTCIIAGCTQLWNKSSRKEQREVAYFFQSSAQNLWFHLPGEVTTTARAGFALKIIKTSLCFAPCATVAAPGRNCPYTAVSATAPYRHFCSFLGSSISHKRGAIRRRGVEIQPVIRRCKSTAFNNKAFQNPREILSSIFQLELEWLQKGFMFNALQAVLNFGLRVSSFKLRHDLAVLHQNSHLFCQWSIILPHFILKNARACHPARQWEKKYSLW